MVLRHARVELGGEVGVLWVKEVKVGLGAVVRRAVFVFQVVPLGLLYEAEGDFEEGVAASRPIGGWVGCDGCDV